MAILSGTRLGPYEVAAQIGAGGMGEVYRAHDSKLARDVAIKVLPANFVNDPERLSRFQREARMLAALNHPNIATIFGLEQFDGVTCLVMELVPGETLAERVKAAPLPIDEALKIAAQIAEALEAAHEKQIIHRDLKPANVKVTPEGKVKVLDFGLAKAFEGDAANEDISNSPTLSRAATMQGVILGTAAYMSPEQARGRSVDKRTDIWAFGCVLYEMLSGKQAFPGEDVTDILAAVVRAEPDWNALPVATPQKLHDLLRRCLKKDKTLRLRDAGDARIEIHEILTAAPIAADSAPPPPRAAFPWIAATAVLLIALAALSLVHFREVPMQQPSVRFQVPPPEQSVISMFRLSPDGRSIAISALSEGRNRLWIRPLDALQWQILQGTDDASYPFWSPDGANIGFFAQGKLKKIAVAGGPPQTLCDAPGGRGGSWSATGVILFTPNLTGGLYKVSTAGGVPEAATKFTAPGVSDSQRYPEFLPDGRHYLYLEDRAGNTGVYAGSLDGTAPTRLLPDNSNAVYVPPTPPETIGYLLFRREGSLMAQPFDAGRIQLAGEIFPVAEQIGIAVNTGQGAFSASKNGELAFRTGGTSGNREFTWMDRAGKRFATVTKSSIYRSGALSPDEKRLALAISNESGDLADLWLQELERGVISRFTFEGGGSYSPVWSRDGSRIVFTHRDAGAQYAIYQRAATGTGKAELILGTAVNTSTWDWSPDGKYVLYSDYQDKTKYDLWLLPIDGDHKPIPYLQTPFSELRGQFSPDGRWMAYVSDESGRYEVYVQTVPASGPKWQVSNAGGDFPRWRRDGKELYFIAADQQLMAVPVKVSSGSSATFEPGAPQPLFRIEPVAASPVAAGLYVPTANGERFLVNVQAGGEGSQAPPITLVLNWTAGLKK